MDASTFRSWLAHVEHLTPEQRQEAAAVLKGRPAVAEVTAIIEDRAGAERRCCRSGTPLPALWDGWSRRARARQRLAAVSLSVVRPKLQCVDRQPLGRTAR
jgi:hypothetical protein